MRACAAWLTGDGGMRSIAADRRERKSVSHSEYRSGVSLPSFFSSWARVRSFSKEDEIGMGLFGGDGGGSVDLSWNVGVGSERVRNRHQQGQEEGGYHGLSVSEEYDPDTACG